MLYATLPRAVLKRIVAVHTAAAKVQPKYDRDAQHVENTQCVHLVGTRGASLEVVATDGVLLVCETFRVPVDADLPADFKLNLTPENVDKLSRVLTGPSKSTDATFSLHVSAGEGVTLTDSRNAYALGEVRGAGEFPTWREALAIVSPRCPGYRTQPESFGLATAYLAKLAELWKSAPLAFKWSGRGFWVSTLAAAKPRGLCDVDCSDARALLMPVQV